MKYSDVFVVIIGVSVFHVVIILMAVVVVVHRVYKIVYNFLMQTRRYRITPLATSEALFNQINVEELPNNSF